MPRSTSSSTTGGWRPRTESGSGGGRRTPLLHAGAHAEVDELVDSWRMAAEDGKRLEGRLPTSFSAGKRVLLLRRPRGVVGVITPRNWPYTMGAALIAP